MSKHTSAKVYGWVPQIPDHRDFIYEPLDKTISNLPPLVDLRPNCPPIYDQGQLGSCTGNGIAFIHEFDQLKQNASSFTPSRLAIYYDERKLEGTIKSDAGANIRDGIKVIATIGTASETLWSYNITKFSKKPPVKYYTAAKLHTSVTYKAVVNNLPTIKACLAENFPIVFGFTVYSSFESDVVASTGVMPMPKKGEQVLGGHCVAMVGYDDVKQVLFCRNSWGENWGLAGYFTMPYAFVANNCSDLWQVSQIR